MPGCRTRRCPRRSGVHRRCVLRRSKFPPAPRSTRRTLLRWRARRCTNVRSCRGSRRCCDSSSGFASPRTPVTDVLRGAEWTFGTLPAELVDDVSEPARCGGGTCQDLNLLTVDPRRRHRLRRRPVQSASPWARGQHPPPGRPFGLGRGHRLPGARPRRRPPRSRLAPLTTGGLLQRREL